jgi:hypothetical protein
VWEAAAWAEILKSDEFVISKYLITQSQKRRALNI